MWLLSRMKHHSIWCFGLFILWWYNLKRYIYAYFQMQSSSPMLLLQSVTINYPIYNGVECISTKRWVVKKTNWLKLQFFYKGRWDGFNIGEVISIFVINKLISIFQHLIAKKVKITTPPSVTLITLTIPWRVVWYHRVLSKYATNMHWQWPILIVSKIFIGVKINCVDIKEMPYLYKIIDDKFASGIK